MKKKNGKFDHRLFSLLAAVILAIPVSWKGLTGFYLWLSPFVMLNSLFSLKTFVWLNSLALFVLFLVVIRKKWFCKYLCPAGWIFDKISSASHRKVINYRRFPEVGRWLAVISLISALFGIPLFIVLDPLALLSGFSSIPDLRITPGVIIYLSVFPLLAMIHLFFPGIWCLKLCPLGGLQSTISDFKIRLRSIFKKDMQGSVAGYPGRRYFLMSGAGLLAGIMIPQFIKASAGQIIRPPAAVVPDLFNTLCCRCGNCIKACPTDIIVPRTGFNDPLAWMTPSISFRSGYCLEDCNLCSRVCPSGAITLFSVEAKGQLFMGRAEITLENCLLVNNTECVKCKDSCKYNAIEFVVQRNILNVKPVVQPKKCVGCGACEVVCPTNCIIIRPLSGTDNL